MAKSIDGIIDISSTNGRLSLDVKMLRDGNFTFELVDNETETSEYLLVLKQGWVSSKKLQEELRNRIAEKSPILIPELDELITKLAVVMAKNIKTIQDSRNGLPISEELEKIDYITTPVTIEDIDRVVNKWLYFRDKDCYQVPLAVAHTQKMVGDPVWMLLVASASSGKSEIIRAFGELANEMVYPVSDFTSASLATGHEKGHDLIPKVNNKIFTIKDLTTLLVGDEKETNKVFGILREMYDGYYKKSFGGEISEKGFKVHTTVIGGVTNVIDEKKIFLAMLGERFLYKRFRNDEEGVSIRSSKMQGMEIAMRKEIKLIILSFLKQTTTLDANISSEHEIQITLIARFLAKVRTGVSKDRWTGVQLSAPESEMSARLTKEFKKLAKSLAIIRGRDEVNDEDIESLKKIALDSCPEFRVKFLSSMIVKRNNPIKMSIATTPEMQEEIDRETSKNPFIYSTESRDTQGISDFCFTNRKTAYYHLEDLYSLQVLEKSKIADMIEEEETSETVADEETTTETTKTKKKQNKTVWNISSWFFDRFQIMFGNCFEYVKEIKLVEEINQNK